MTEINLSRALKLKNRMVHRLGQLDSTITTFNSTTEESQEYNVRKVYKARVIMAADLVRMKVMINAANHPVQHLIFELAECKALIAMLGRVSTKHGPTVEGYSGVRVNYVAQMRKPDIDREVRRVEREIDRIQDDLDRFNYRTKITVPTAWLADEESDPDAIVAGYEQARRSSDDAGAGP